MASSPQPHTSDQPVMEQIVTRNIAALLARRQSQEQTIPFRIVLPIESPVSPAACALSTCT